MAIVLIWTKSTYGATSVLDLQRSNFPTVWGRLDGADISTLCRRWPNFHNTSYISSGGAHAIRTAYTPTDLLIYSGETYPDSAISFLRMPFLLHEHRPNLSRNRKPVRKERSAPLRVTLVSDRGCSVRLAIGEH